MAETENGAGRLETVKLHLSRGLPLKIAGLGDSLTQGWMVAFGFFDRVVDRLENTFPENTITRINAGVPGDTAAGGLNRLPSILDRNPDLITIQFGINDMYSGVSVEDYSSRIRATINRILKTPTAPVIVTSCPLADDTDQTQISRYYDRLRQLGREMKVPVADCELHWRKTASIKENLLDDGVHPSNAGHSLMADAIMNILVP